MVESKWDTSWVCFYLCQRWLTPESLLWRVKWNTSRLKAALLRRLYSVVTWFTRPTGTTACTYHADRWLRGWWHLMDFNQPKQSRVQKDFVLFCCFIALIWGLRHMQDIWSCSDGTSFGSSYWELFSRFVCCFEQQMKKKGLPPCTWLPNIQFLVGTWP